MSRFNVGGIPEVTADEDTDRDVEIADSTRTETAKGKSARQRIEEMREERELNKEDM